MKRRRWIQHATVIGWGGLASGLLGAQGFATPGLGAPGDGRPAIVGSTVKATSRGGVDEPNPVPFDDWPAEIRDPIHRWTQGRPVVCQGLWLDLPELVDNGNDVALQLRAEPGGGTNGCFIERVTVWAPRNPHPLVLEAEFTRHLPRAELTTRIRLASSQRVFALARASDGRMFCAHRSVLVALAACIEG